MNKSKFSMLLIFFLLMVVGKGYAQTSIINIYEANGNLVNGDGRYYEYNDANQLTKVRQGDNQSGPIIAEYFYDASGKRVKKIENGVVTYYVGKHFEKQIGGANPGNTNYYFGEGGERVARKDPAGNVFYYHLDHLDGINVVTDSAGTQVSRTDYLPFGELREGGTGSDKYSYTGKEKDKTDLYYFDARYNSPEFRHFTQADIADPDYDDPQDLNRYAYVGNNPLSYVDEDGFKKKKKAKLSKREKWMIAHGVDPDHDKTPLKKAKAQFKAGKKYTNVAKSKTPTASSVTYSLASVGTVQGRLYDGGDANTITNGKHHVTSGQIPDGQAAYYSALAGYYCPDGNGCISTTTGKRAAWGTGPGKGWFQEEGPLLGWINEHAPITTNFSASWHESSNYWLSGRPVLSNFIITIPVFLGPALYEAFYNEASHSSKELRLEVEAYINNSAID